jgi:5-(carboxyamino)imidazole ribonucleotide synthase
MRHTKKNAATLGILGGGQLGMLLARAAKARDLRVHLYIEKEEHFPAMDWADQVFMGDDWSDIFTLKNFAASCDVILLENEFVPADLLAATPTKFVPELTAYRQFQNKEREKLLAASLGIPVVPWRRVHTIAEVRALGPVVLKTTEGGYDGYGNLVVTTKTPDKNIERFLEQGTVIAEDQLAFTHEVAIVVARAGDNVVSFPIAETIQEKQICHYVIAPARLPADVLARVQDYAERLVRGAQGDGVFGVEFFVTSDGQVIYNETAPRPHNSAHFTLAGCDLSQFDMIVRLALGEELIKPTLTSQVVGMLNLLGTRHGPPELKPADEFKEGQLCLYGKPWSRPGRKMGHYNLTGASSEVVLEQLRDLQQRYQL